MPTVLIPPPYRGPTEGHARVEVEASSVRDALHAVDARYPGFGEQIFDASGAVHGFVKLFKNGDPIDPGSLDTGLAGTDALASKLALL